MSTGALRLENEDLKCGMGNGKRRMINEQWNPENKNEKNKQC